MFHPLSRGLRRPWLLASVVIVMSTGGLAARQSPSDAALRVQPDSLAALVAELEQRNPELEAARADVAMRAARISPAGALPDPALSISSMTGLTRPPFFPADTTVNAFRLVGVSQELPFPGKRDLRRAVAATDVKTAQMDVEMLRRQLVVDLKTACLEYDLVLRKMAILADSKALATQLRQAAESRLSVGKGTQQDVIRAQLEMSMVLAQQVELAQQTRQWTSRIKALLFRSPDAPAPAAVSFVVEPALADLAALHAWAGGASAAVQREQTLIARGETALRLATRELKPDFRVGLTAQKYAAGMPWMYGVDLMVSLPIYRRQKQRPQIAEAAAALAASHQTSAATAARVTAQVDEAYSMMVAADQLIGLYGDSILPQARLSIESSLAAYQLGDADFLAVLQSAQALLAAEVARAEQQTRRAQALVALEPLVGRVFVQ